MKKIFPVAVVFAAIIMFCGCGVRETYRIEGKFRVSDPTPVRLFYLSEKEAILTDSVFANSGSFTIKNKAHGSGIYLMKFFNDQSVYLIIHPGDHIKIDIDNSNGEISYYISNSFDSKRVKELTDKQKILLKSIDQLSNELERNREDLKLRNHVDSLYNKLMQEHKEYTVSFIYEEPGSLANILAVYQNFGRKTRPLFDKYDDFEIFNFVDSNLIIRYPEADAVKALNREVSTIREQIRQKKYIEKVIEEGRSLPPFRYGDINGDSIILRTDFKKPVLLFFWATWNSYSVEELIRLNEFARSAQGRNVSVATVSLDSSEEKLKSFIAERGIILPVVCDYLYWESDIAGRYAIKQLPASILVSKNGIIVNIDIFGDELYQRINDLIK